MIFEIQETREPCAPRQLSAGTRQRERKVKQINFDVGPIGFYSTEAVTKVAKDIITRQHTGQKEMSEADAVKEVADKTRELQGLPPKAQTILSGTVKKIVAALRKQGVTMKFVNNHTVSQKREDWDIRNPVNHAAGYAALVRIVHPDGSISFVHPRLGINFDLTGKGVGQRDKQ